jgi:hypothetical protein
MCIKRLIAVRINFNLAINSDMFDRKPFKPKKSRSLLNSIEFSLTFHSAVATTCIVPLHSVHTDYLPALYDSKSKKVKFTL